jgi:hypothetical protein
MRDLKKVEEFFIARDNSFRMLGKTYEYLEKRTKIWGSLGKALHLGKPAQII